jgi:hypothetical protein
MEMDMQEVSDAGLAGVLPGTTGAADPFSAFPVAGATGIFEGTGAGQQGVTPLVGTGGSMSGAINGLWDWLNRPFNRQLSIVTVFGYVGAVIIAVIVWNLILYHVRIAGEAI